VQPLVDEKSRARRSGAATTVPSSCFHCSAGRALLQSAALERCPSHQETTVAESIELTEQMKSQIGKESPPWDYEVTTTSVRMFARGVGYTDPVYFDVEAAKKAGYRSLPAPPTYLGTAVFLPGRCSDTFSGPTEGIPSLNHGLKGLLDGGTETEYFDTICAGDTLVAVQKLVDAKVAPSTALGGKMLIVTGVTTYTSKSTGNIVAKQTSQVIYY
jgi:hypothetical protein